MSVNLCLRTEVLRHTGVAKKNKMKNNDKYKTTMKHIITLNIFFFATLAVFSQKEKKFIREGNRNMIKKSTLIPKFYTEKR